MSTPPPRTPRYAHVTKTLRPGQPGTLKLARRHGDALVCVRYREDGPGQRRCTTVELIVDESPVQRRMSERTLVQVSIPWEDQHLRERAKRLGAQWNTTTKTWRMTLRTAKSLGLQERIKPASRK